MNATMNFANEVLEHANVHINRAIEALRAGKKPEFGVTEMSKQVTKELESHFGCNFNLVYCLVSHHVKSGGVIKAVKGPHGGLQLREPLSNTLPQKAETQEAIAPAA